MARGPAQNSRELGNCPETGVWWGLGGNGHVQTHPRDHTIHLGRGISLHLDFGTISHAKPCFSDSWLWAPGSRRRPPVARGGVGRPRWPRFVSLEAESQLLGGLEGGAPQESPETQEGSIVSFLGLVGPCVGLSLLGQPYPACFQT